jgi:hypothetical protein
MKKHFLLFTLILSLAGTSFAQKYIYVSEDGIRKVVRADIGYAQWTMEAGDSSIRTAQGIHLLNEIKIFSWLSENWNGFALHDAFYVNLDLGILKEDAHTKFIRGGVEKESQFCMNGAFGYLGMLGWRAQRWGALAGMDLRVRASRIGDLTMPNIDGPLLFLSTPLVFRAEYGMSKKYPDFRVLLTGWKTLGSTKFQPYESLRLEFPLNKNGRFWLLAQYNGQTGLSEDAFLFTEPQETKFKQYLVGIRVGNLP